MTKLEGVTSMFAGTWCGQYGLIGWVLMGLFWVTFLGLVVWAMSRLFAPTQVTDGHDVDVDDHEVGDRDVGDADDLVLRLARGQIDLSEYQTLRQEVITSGHH